DRQQDVSRHSHLVRPGLCRAAAPPRKRSVARATRHRRCIIRAAGPRAAEIPAMVVPRFASGAVSRHNGGKHADRGSNESMAMPASGGKPWPKSAAEAVLLTTQEMYRADAAAIAAGV